MPLNLGYVEATRDDRDIVVRVYYDTNWLIENPSADPNLAPLVDGTFVNGGRGWCLDVTNISGARVLDLTIFWSGGTFSVPVAKGNPVTTGRGRSRKAVDMAALGLTTRGDVGDLRLG